MSLQTEDRDPGTSTGSTERGFLPGIPSTSAAAIVFAVVEVCAVPILMSWGRGQTFIGDDFDFLAVRRAGSLHDLFAAHVDHWVTLPVLAYRSLWWAVGMRSYVPYQLLVVALHLAAAALLRLVMRRAGVNEWIATIAATVFVFFGAGVENIVVAFQITFVGSLVFGLVQLLLADHDGSINRRDALGLGAGVLALLCSGIGAVLIGVTALTVLLRRGWRIALFHSVPLAAAYIAWYASIGHRTSSQLFETSTWGERAAFVRTGIAATFGAIGRVPPGGYLVAAMLIAGWVVLISSSGWSVLRGRAAAPIALLAGAFAMLAVTAVGRAGKPKPIIRALVALQGSSHARQSRVLHLAAAMMLPALAVAADALIRRRRVLALAVIPVLVIGMPSNFVNHTIPPFDAKSRSLVELYKIEARSPILSRLPRDTFVAPYITVGWLVDGAKSGRIPHPNSRRPIAVANVTMKLAYQPFIPQVDASPCASVAGATRLTVTDGTITVKGVPFSLYTVLDDGTRSVPIRVPAGRTFRIRGGPLDVVLVPVDDGPAQVCGPS